MSDASRPTPTMGWAAAPHRHSLHVERVIDPHTQQSVVGMVRHPGCAWRATWDSRTNPDPHQVGQAYLQDLDEALSRCRPEDAGDTFLPRGALDALRASAGKVAPADGFGWLDVTWTQAKTDPKDTDNPKGSYWLRRQTGELLHDASLVLLAGRRIGGWLLGDDIGLRLVVHRTAPREARVYGVTLAGLSQAMAPRPKGLLSGGGDALRDLKQTLKTYFGAQDEVWITGLVPVTGGASQTPDTLRVSGHLYRRPSGEARPVPKTLRSLTYRFSVLVNNAQQVVRLLQFRQVRAQAVAPVRAFPIDPASRDVADDPGLSPTAAELNRRPGRSSERLGRYQAELLRVWPHDGRLQHSDGTGRVLFEVRGPQPWPAQAQATPQARAAAPEAASTSADEVTPPSVVTLRPSAMDANAQTARDVPGAPETVNPPRTPSSAAAKQIHGIHVHAGDDAAALHAYLRTRELFDRLAAYGFDAHAYFRMAELPLVIRPRAATAWGADGEATTAEVRPFYGQAFGTRGRSVHLGRPQLVVKFGAADAAHRVMRDAPGRLSLRQADPHPHRHPRAQYLGVAADPRWAWHEFGHVLNHASTGELEFAFAHSAGDALAAIVCDPRSRLARSPGQRGITFPWIEVPGRRHDRSPLRGYCWCGHRNRLRLDVKGRQERFQHGYFEEQLLSSSLFRLYRCLGGDTAAEQDGTADAPDDLARRLLASDQVVYLVMRAIGVLGPDSLATARTADQFVSALIDADLGTGRWRVTAPWPYEHAAPRQLRMVGGRLHKLIRWAFEQQGLYATDQPDEACEGLGQPPAVDLYIGDRRRQAEGAPPDGGYWPVPLRGGAEPAPWWAHQDWVTRQGAGIQVRVGNRGLHAATGLKVRGWYWADGDTAWRRLARQTHGALNPADTVDVQMTSADGPLPDGPLWVLAVVDCPADASLLPCDATPPASPANPTALMDWVAHDNNIAVLRLDAAG